MKKHDGQLENLGDRADDTEKELAETKIKLERTESNLSETQSELSKTQSELSKTQSVQKQMEDRLTQTESQVKDLQEKEKTNNERRANFSGGGRDLMNDFNSSPNTPFNTITPNQKSSAKRNKIRSTPTGNGDATPPSSSAKRGKPPSLPIINEAASPRDQAMLAKSRLPGVHEQSRRVQTTPNNASSTAAATPSAAVKSRLPGAYEEPRRLQTTPNNASSTAAAKRIATTRSSQKKPIARRHTKSVNERRQEKVKKNRALLDDKASKGKLNKGDFDEFKNLIEFKGPVVASMQCTQEEIDLYNSKKSNNAKFSLNFILTTKKETVSGNNLYSKNCKVEIISKSGRLVDTQSVWFAPGTYWKVTKSSKVPDSKVSGGLKYNFVWEETTPSMYLDSR